MVSVLKKRLFSILLVLLAASSSALFLSYTNWNERRIVTNQNEAQKVEFAKIDSDVKASVERKLAAAKKAEADAKALALSQKPSPSSSKPSTQNCDVTEPNTITIVVNKKHCFSPADWAPADLTSVEGYMLRDIAATQLSSMMASASAAGVGFGISSAYRSYANQLATYNNWVAVNGSVAAADTVSARPGFSEHQTGLAVDLRAGGCTLGCFGTSSQYAWLQSNAGEYGFIERYPVGLTSITGYAAEPWHWRYVGKDTALDMKTKGIQTLEQYFGVSGGDYAG